MKTCQSRLNGKKQQTAEDSQARTKQQKSKTQQQYLYMDVMLYTRQDALICFIDEVNVSWWYVSEAADETLTFPSPARRVTQQEKHIRIFVWSSDA